MRIVVISDSHRAVRYLYKIVEKHMDTADLFVFLGDIDSDFDNVLMLYPNINYQRVAGNNDWSSVYPYEKLLDLNGKKVFICHGHTQRVKYGYEQIVTTSRNLGADLCLFGHTHIQYSNYDNGLYVLNPGAVCSGEYAMVDIEKSGIVLIPCKI